LAQKILSVIQITRRYFQTANGHISVNCCEFQVVHGARHDTEILVQADANFFALQRLGPFVACFGNTPETMAACQRKATQNQSVCRVHPVPSAPKFCTDIFPVFFDSFGGNRQV
jgi:hypothetical protein